MTDGPQDDVLNAFLNRAGKTDATIDLTGLSIGQAIPALDQGVAHHHIQGHLHLLIKIDPPPPGGGETLFQPVGRHLLALLRQNKIGHCAPIVSDREHGYFVSLHPRPSRESSVSQDRQT